MAAYDYCKWKKNTEAALSSGASALILKSSESSSNTCTGNDSALCLRISWNKINQNNLKKNLQSKSSPELEQSSLELEITP
jgi:hypothetical protein